MSGPNNSTCQGQDDDGNKEMFAKVTLQPYNPMPPKHEGAGGADGGSSLANKELEPPSASESDESKGWFEEFEEEKRRRKEALLARMKYRPNLHLQLTGQSIKVSEQVPSTVATTSKPTSLATSLSPRITPASSEASLNNIGKHRDVRGGTGTSNGYHENGDTRNNPGPRYQMDQYHNHKHNQGNSRAQSGTQGQGHRGGRGGGGARNGYAVQGNCVFVSGLPSATSKKALGEYFGSIGEIEIDEDTGYQKIWMYKDKTSGKSNGKCTVTYIDPDVARSAIAWFHGKEYGGKVLNVTMFDSAKNSGNPNRNRDGGASKGITQRGRGGQRAGCRGGRGGRGRGPMSKRGSKMSLNGKSNEDLNAWDEFLSDDSSSVCSGISEARVLCTNNGNLMAGPESSQEGSPQSGAEPNPNEETLTSEIAGSLCGNASHDDDSDTDNTDVMANDEEAESFLTVMNDYLKISNEEAIARKNEAPHAQLQRKLRELSKHQQSLPIFQHKDALMKAISENQVLIVHGETGSGKSTQIPQYLVKAGFAKTGTIGITQPRRIAASSLAERVADELKENLGGKVGYAVRFDKKVSRETVIKYVTDGYLLKECSSEPEVLFKGYSVVMIDEAHERSLHTDVILGLAKRAVNERKDLKVIVSSATLEYEKLSEFFNDAPVFNISGKCYNVEVIHEPEIERETQNKNDYLKRVADVIKKINREEQPGDVLVFLPGKEEIEDVKSKIQDLPNIVIKICHSSLPFEEQQQIYDPPPHGHRKIVLATNIAETSITIDGIVYVVDSGYFKQNLYNPITKISQLVEQRITQFHAIQRQGRAGRTRPGKCYRIYKESEYNQFKVAPVPDIQRENLESVVLDLCKLGVKNPLNGFDFIDKPPVEAVCEAVIHLMELSALTNSMQLTNKGMKMAELPVEPPLAKVLIESWNLGCQYEVCIIVAMLSGVQHRNLFVSSDPKNKKRIEGIKRKFDSPDGDHLSLLKIYQDWKTNPDKNKWCTDNFISGRYLAEAESITKQLFGILKSTQNDVPAPKEMDPMKLSENIRKAFTAGYFRQIAAKVGRQHNRYYEPVMARIHGHQNKYVALHGSSSLHWAKEKPKLVIFHEVSKNKEKSAFMRDVSVIEWPWFKEYARKFYDKLQAIKQDTEGLE